MGAEKGANPARRAPRYVRTSGKDPSAVESSRSCRALRSRAICAAVSLAGSGWQPVLLDLAEGFADERIRLLLEPGARLVWP